jgi:translation initiation factor IF-2
MTVATTKYKLFKVCKELNVGMDTISSFLEEKGIKVKGPNTSFPEEIYMNILEKFAKEKELADIILKRRKQFEGTIDEQIVDPDIEPEQKKKPAYVEIIEKSIEEGVEEIKKEEEKPKKEITKKSKIEDLKEKEDKEDKEDNKDKKDKKLIAESIVTDEKKSEEPEEKKVKDSRIIGHIDIDKIQGHRPSVSKKSEKEEQLKISTDETDEISKEKKKKKTEEDKKKEKEDKRRRAFDMIRKEEKRKKDFSKTGLVGEGDKTSRLRTRKQRKKKEVDQKEVQQTVKKTLASLDDKLKKHKRRKKIKEDTGEEIEENIIYASEFISANDLANLMDVPVSDILTKCLELGLLVSINQRLELDTIELLANEWDYTVVKEEEFASDLIDDVIDSEEGLENDEPRSPIITIMGHVDHGKTSLLDYIRKTNVVEGESGGITQHIGAYQVNKNGKSITFLDTPGHEAFTAMRARGAQVTDIVILIIAADDQIMPQTDEALDHAKAAGVKIIIAINKIDKPGSDPKKIRQQLAERNILVEDWGGQVQIAEISAKTGVGIDELLEKVVLEAELLDLKANSKKMAKGTVIEAQVDKGKGNVATVLIQNGTIKIGDPFLAGKYAGRVRALYNDKNQIIKSAGPSTPVQILGFDGLPQAGDKFLVMADERTVREISGQRQRIQREQEFRQHRLTTLDQISESIRTGDVKELPVIIKADVDGSAEALSDSLIKLNVQEVNVVVVRKAVGPISESDVILASASNAIIIGFHVRANAKAKELADKEKIEIRNYKVVYDAINDVKMALEGMLGTDKSEEVTGTVEIRETYKISRLGTIAGCHVLSGKITRNSKIRLIRDDVEIYSGELASLKRFKEDAKEVETGFECGIQIQNYNDVKLGDIIEAYTIKEIKRTLK